MDTTGLGVATRSRVGKAPALKTDRRETHGDRPGADGEGWTAALHELNRIGMTLMAEEDPGTLLQLVLGGARSLTRATTASLYLVERDAGGARGLRFIGCDADSLPDAEGRTFCLPLDDMSIAGRVVAAAEPVVVDDVNEVAGMTSTSWDASAFTSQYGVRARSILTVPMVDRHGRVCGALQIVDAMPEDPNSSRVVDGPRADAAAPTGWTRRDVALASALAGQAAVAIETRRRFQNAENLLEGLVRATVSAVDGRIPSMAGHSIRVADLTCALARLIDGQTRGPFAETRFPPDRLRQLRYACLLHDLGKVGVSEAVLEKRNKLTPVVAARIADRFELIRTLKRLEAARGECEDLDAELRHLDDLEHLVRSADVPGPPDPRVLEALRRMASESWTGTDGETRPLLTGGELGSLGIGRGSLDDEERQTVESHVEQTCAVLRQVPWTPDLARVVAIVRGTHERLDGSGYPDGVRGDRLPLESRMMAVCDTYDALTASDRPYRKAMVPTDALLVLEQEARQGELDADVVELFVGSEVYRSVARMRPATR